jgi:hypothetical protein
LYYRSELSGFYFVKKKCENNGHGKTEYEAINTEQCGIAQKPEEIDAAEKIFEVLKPDPGTAGHPPERIEILKRDKSAVHWHIVEDEIINNGGKEKKVQGYITSSKYSVFFGMYHPTCFLSWFFSGARELKTVRKKIRRTAARNLRACKGTGFSCKSNHLETVRKR